MNFLLFKRDRPVVRDVIEAFIFRTIFIYIDVELNNLEAFGVAHQIHCFTNILRIGYYTKSLDIFFLLEKGLYVGNCLANHKTCI